MKRPFDFGPAPAGWRPTRLRSIVTRKKQIGRPDLPLLSVNLPSGVVPRAEDSGRPAASEDLSGYQHVLPGDLVMNQLGKPHGALGVSLHEGIISPAYFVATISPSVDARFLHHLLRTRLYISEYERRGKYMPPNQFDISWDEFRQIELLLPPLDAQRTIADYLDRETARIDSLITKKQQMVELLKDRFEAAIFHAVTRGIRGARPMRAANLSWLVEVPAEWGTPTVSTNFELQLGKMLNAEAANGVDQFAYVRNVNVQWDRIDAADLATMHFSETDRRRCELRSGDVLVCEGGEVGRAAVWADDVPNCYFQKAIHRARPRNGANSRFLMYCLRAAAKMNVFAVQGNLSTIVHLTGEQLAVHRFPWPPTGEQAEIVERLDSQAAVVRSTCQRLTSQIDLLREHRQALITAAVTGELEVPGVAA